jgi:glycosyltransferase involved in cell wall biosynthesis
MRIGIDYTAAVRQGAGIGRYTRQLVQALLELDTQNEYVLLAAAADSGLSREATLGRPDGFDGLALDGVSPGRVRTVPLPVSERLLTILWHRLRLPLWVEWATGALDVFHSPDFVLPPVRRARTVLTVHDLSFVRVPECADPGLRSYLQHVVPASARRADIVLADSECTKADVVELLGVDVSRVVVVYPGVESRFQRVQDQHTLDAVRQRYNLPDRFALGLGTLQPRKNLGRLIEAYAGMREGLGSGLHLVIAGGAGWMYEGVFRRVAELGLQNLVSFPGYIADEDLPALYSLADLFVFPSLYEGFGLPVLEAMACGTPVVTSAVSSLPEVAGDAALLVDPLDTQALAEAMRRVMDDAKLRSEMVQKGLDQARRFTWSGSARQLLETYHRLD